MATMTMLYDHLLDRVEKQAGRIATLEPKENAAPFRCGEMVIIRFADASKEVYRFLGQNPQGVWAKNEYNVIFYFAWRIIDFIAQRGEQKEASDGE